MYIESVPNRNSPTAILLRESYRDGAKVKKRTITNLSDWPGEIVEGLRTLLKGGKATPPADQDSIIIHRSLPHGHVAAVLGTLRTIGLDRILGPRGNRPRDLVIAMIAARLSIAAIRARSAAVSSVSRAQSGAVARYRRASARSPSARATADNEPSARSTPAGSRKSVCSARLCSR